MQYAFMFLEVSATKVFTAVPSHVAMQFTFLPWLIRSIAPLPLLLAVSEPSSDVAAQGESLGKHLVQSQMSTAASLPPEMRCRPLEAL